MSTKAQDSATKDEAVKLIEATNAALNGSGTVDIQPTETETETELQFKVGWSYDVFLRKNKLAPSENASSEWRRFNRETARAHVHTMAELTAAGMKTTCKRSAVWSMKDRRYNTAMTARVIQPGCDDGELIADCYVKQQARQAKTLAAMRAAAINQGADIS